MPAASAVELVARCHCGHFDLPISLAADELPQRKTICVCDSCRYGTGTLGVVTVTLPGPPAADVLDALTLREMKAGSKLRYRCPTCGANALGRITGPDGKPIYTVYVGLLSQLAGVVEIVGFEYCEGHGDTGVAAFLPELPVYSGKADESPLVPPLRKAPATGVQQATEQLSVRCDCGSIDLSVSRPADDAEAAYCYIKPPPTAGGVATRFLTTSCACTSCRTTTGSCLPAHAVTHVPWQNLHEASDPAVPLLTGDWSPQVTLPGAVAYHSSDKTTRYRCAGDCGASLGIVTAAMPGILKVSTGLLHAPEGPRAESWAFWWTGTDEPYSKMPPTINAADEAPDQALMRDWLAGLKRWGIENGLRS
jgi:hypothetical protein